MMCDAISRAGFAKLLDMSLCSLLSDTCMQVCYLVFVLFVLLSLRTMSKKRCASRRLAPVQDQQYNAEEERFHAETCCVRTPGNLSDDLLRSWRPGAKAGGSTQR